MELITKSPRETKALGKKIAVDLISKGQRRKGAIVLALTGELGSGKTTFAQGFAEGLGIKGRIISPTFILMRKYDISSITKNRSPFTHFYHIDFYRFEENIESEAKNLGIEEFWDNPENIVVIEWAEKIKDLVPKNATWVEFENLGRDKRKVRD